MPELTVDHRRLPTLYTLLSRTGERPFQVRLLPVEPRCLCPIASSYEAEGNKAANSHSGRRRFVTTLGDKGINPRLVQVLVRHRHLNTIMRYIEVNDAKLRKAVELVD